MATALSIDDLLSTPSREFIILAGKDGSGKSSAVIALAEFLADVMAPDATVFIIDTENKIKPVLQSWGGPLPRNIQYYRATDMNEATEAMAAIVARWKPGDWVCVESMGRVWEKSQDLGYKAVTGLDKAKYLERRREKVPAGQKQPPVTPKPDDLWSVTKGAHDGDFLEVIAQAEHINVLLTTTMAKPPKEGMPNRKENADRAAFRAEHGIEAGLEGAPRLPYYAQTLALLEKRNGKNYCRILRDNLSTQPDPCVEFEIGDKKAWPPQFWSLTR